MCCIQKSVIHLGHVHHLPRLKTWLTSPLSTLPRNKVAMHVGARLPRSCRDTFPSCMSTFGAQSQSASVSSLLSQVSEPPGAMDNAESALPASFNGFHPSPPKKSLNAKPHLSPPANSSPPHPSPLSFVCLAFPNKRGNSENTFLCNSVIFTFFFGNHQTLRVRFEITYRAFARNSLSLEKRERERRGIISSLKYTA